MKKLLILTFCMLFISGCETLHMSKTKAPDMNTGSIQPMKIYPHSLKAKNFKAYYPIPKAGSVAQQGLVDVLPPGMDKGKEQVQQAQSGHYTSNPIVNPIEKVMSKID